MCWCSARVVLMVNTNGADGILSCSILLGRLYLLSDSVRKTMSFKSYRAVIINKESTSYPVRTFSPSTSLRLVTVGLGEEQGNPPPLEGLGEVFSQ